MSAGALQRELAEALANRFPSAADVDRVAAAAGLSLGEIARHPRPIDHWSAAIAEAIEGGRLRALLDEAGADMPKLDRAHFAPIADVDRSRDALAISLAVEWDDLDGVERGRPWRVEDRGVRRPLVVELRVFGEHEASEPRVDWRTTSFFGRGPWKSAGAERDGDARPGFALWRARAQLESGALRATGLQVRASVGDQRAQIERRLAPRAGVRAALGVLALAFAFTVVWLQALPGPTIVWSLGGALLVAALGAGRALIAGARARGPALGLGFVEPAVLVAIALVAAVWSVPPHVMSIVENHTGAPIRVQTASKTSFSLGPGDRAAALRWDLPPNVMTDARDAALCRCPDDAAVPGCACPEPHRVRGVAVIDVECRRPQWPGGAGVIDMDPTCMPHPASATISAPSRWTNAARAGDIIVHPPWREDLGAIDLDPQIVASQMSLHAGAVQVELADVELVRTVRLPLIDAGARDLTVAFGKDATLICSHADRIAALAPIALHDVDALVVSVDGSVSRWSGKGTPVACRRAAPGTTSIELDTSAPPRGVLTFPSWLAHREVTVAVNGTRIAAPCTADAAVVEVGTGVPDTATVADGHGTTWTIAAAPIGGKRFALVCDPPGAPTRVTRAGSRDALMLTAERLARADVPPPDTICWKLADDADVSSTCDRSTCPAGCTTLVGADAASLARKLEISCDVACACPARPRC